MGSLKSLFGFGPKVPVNAPHFPHDIRTNPYRAKRPWPPDYSQLSHKHQFLLERRFRRRHQLKWARPTWMKATKLFQWGSILFVLVYGVMYLDVNDFDSGDKSKPRPERRTVLDGIKDLMTGQVDDLHAFRKVKDSADPRQVPNNEKNG